MTLLLAEIALSGPLVGGAVALLGSLAVCLKVARWSLGNVRYVRRERAQRLAALARERERVEAEEREAACSWPGYRKFQVVERTAEDGAPSGRRSEMASLVLSPFQQNGLDLPRFRPGQYVQLRLDIPGQPTLLSRCYSLTRAWAPDRYQITVARAPSRADPLTGEPYPPGIVSSFLLDRVQERTVLDITVPQGDFWLDPLAADPVVLVGWGIHAAPLLGILDALADLPEREGWLFLEVPSEDTTFSALLPQVLQKVQRAGGRLRAWISVFAHAERVPEELTSDSDDQRAAAGDAPIVRREGHQAVAWIKRVVPAHYAANAQVYVSGPALRLREAKFDLAAWGVPEDHVHFEVFDRESLDAIADEAEDTGECQVTFESAKKTVAWDPEARTLLGLASENKVRIPSTCKIGKCGECEVALISGKVRYTSDPSFKVKQGNCLPCIATPASAAVVLGT